VSEIYKNIVPKAASKTNAAPKNEKISNPDVKIKTSKLLSIKKILNVFVVPFFVVSITVVVVLSLACNMGIKFVNNIFVQK
jgi:hypothetical protein